MKDLLANYSLSEVVLFLIIAAIAIKELIQLIDWFKCRVKNAYDKDHEAQEEHEKLENEIEDLNKLYDEKKIVDEGFKKFEEAFKKVNDQIEMLIESDKEDIKSFITVQHHYFVYEKHWIDDYSMECIEKRFAIYEREHGNSFVKGLMNEIRALPKRPPADIEHMYIGTARYITETNGQMKL